MSWFSNLFKWPEEHPASETPPRQIIEWIVKDISEPIYSFVETFKANPKRFKCKELDLNELDKVAHNASEYGPWIRRFKLIDNYEKLSWEFTTEIYSVGMCDEEVRGPGVITSNEAKYIYDAMKPYFEKLEMKRLNLMLYRYRRPLRRKLTEVYCK